MIVRTHLSLLLVLVAATVASAQEPPRPPGMPPIGGGASAPALPAKRDVTITTADHLTIAATFWPAAAEKAPGVVLLHMFGSDRSAWDPLVPALRRRGIAVLAIDLRGHGDSAVQGKKNLSALVTKRDPKLFAAMHQDAFAAVTWLAQEGGADPQRIALVGASVGCSVAIDTTCRHPAAVAAVLCMSPGAKYLGIDTLAQLATFPADTPLCLLVHRSEMAGGAEKIVELRPTTALVVYDEPPPEALAEERAWAHGTKMFGRLPVVDLTVASFVAARTGVKGEDVVLDGIVSETGPASDAWSDAPRVSPPGGSGWVRAFRVGRRVLFGGVAPAGFTGLRFEVQSGPAQAGGERPLAIGPPQVVCVDLAKGGWIWSWGGMGSIPDIPGMDMSDMFGKTHPALRVVTGENGSTFEGEWTVPAMGGADGAVRLFVRVDKEPNPRPGAGVATDLENAVDLPAR